MGRHHTVSLACNVAPGATMRLGPVPLAQWSVVHSPPNFQIAAYAYSGAPRLALYAGLGPGGPWDYILTFDSAGASPLTPIGSYVYCVLRPCDANDVPRGGYSVARVV